MSGQGSESLSPHGTGRGQPVLHQEFLEENNFLNFLPVVSNVSFQTCILKLPEAPLPAAWGPLACGFAIRYVTGWFSPYHRRRKLIHPIMIQHIQPQALRYPPRPCVPARGRLCLAPAM